MSTLPRTAADVLANHVTLEVESIDRMYLNLYVPILQAPAGCAHFWIRHRGYKLASSALMEPMTRRFVSNVESFALAEGIDLITFEKGERKEEIAQARLAKFPADEGVLFIGKAQEKAKVVRTRRLRNAKTGASYPDLYMTTSLVNHYYFYCVDRDFGPFFIKLCSYFPYNGKLCINGHEYAKRQLTRAGIAYEALDNGIVSCAEPARLQKICDGLSAERIDALARKWLRRLPHPFLRTDRAAGYLYDISILQAEFSLTQALDRPVSGRVFFEDVIRDNLDLGRPDRVQLIFERRVTRRTPGRFRTRVITDGVTPSFHVEYKHSRIKQYHKLGRALRTETTINDTRDFAIGKRLHNLPELRKVGFKANRRLLRVQQITHDPSLGEDAFARIQQPTTAQGQRAAAIRFGDPRSMALLAALSVYRLLPRGFSNHELRQYVASLLGVTTEQHGRGKMTYDLRRLRLHGLIERIPRTHRYHVTEYGFRTATFLSRLHGRVLRRGLALAHDPAASPSTLRNAFEAVERAIDNLRAGIRFAA
jgi:hypothetical protein